MDYKTAKNLDDKFSMKTYARTPIVWVSGRGAKLYDSAGREYTDFLAGLATNCLGYGDSELTQTIAVQASKLLHVSNLFHTAENAELVKLLVEGSDFSKAFLCNSGAEANECVIKLVRKYYSNFFGDKKIILSALNSFHGRTLATVTMTGQEKYSEPFKPLPEGFRHVPHGDLKALKDALKTYDVGALVLETIQGEGGVIPATKEYIQEAYGMCKDFGAFFILDEIQTGVGRTGKLFSYEHYGIKPDAITLAKGLGGGLPIGAVLARGDLAECFVPGDHGTTFGGNPMSCKAATVVVNRLKNTDLLQKVASNGEYLMEKLSELKKAPVLEIRGKGLLIGMQLDSSVKGSEVVLKMLQKGFVLNCCGQNTLRFCPPFVITKREIDGMTAVLKEVLFGKN
jgi:predicted acetylornithine/succinylornithine family transaminase